MSFAGQREGKPGCRGSCPDARARRLAARDGVEDQMRDAVGPGSRNQAPLYVHRHW